MERRTKLLAGGIAVVVALLAGWLVTSVLSLGCGLGNASVYPVYDADRSVESPVDARRTIHDAYVSNESVYADDALGDLGPTRDEFNRSYVYVASPREAVQNGVPARSSRVDEGERFYLFSGSGGADYDVGVTVEGDVFLLEHGIC